MKFIIYSITLFLYTATVQAQWTVSDVKSHSRKYVYTNATDMVMQTLKDLQDPGYLKVPDSKVKIKNFTVTRIEGATQSEQRVHFSFDLKIQNQSCIWIDVGNHSSWIDLHFFFDQYDVRSYTWYGSPKLSTNYILEGNARTDNIPNIVNDIFPNEGIDEELINRYNDCKELTLDRADKLKGIDRKALSKLDEVYVYNLAKKQLNLVNHLNTIGDGKPVMVMNFKAMSHANECSYIAADIMQQLEKNDALGVFSMLITDIDFSVFQAAFGQYDPSDKDYPKLLWSKYSEKKSEGIAIIKKNNTTPDFFIFKNGKLIYYMDGITGDSLDNTIDILMRGMKASKSTTSYNKIKGLTRV